MPARFSDIVRAAKKMGATLTTGKGAHHKLRGPNGRAYTISAHNGMKSEVDDKYIRGLCNAFEWDVEEFKKEL